MTRKTIAKASSETSPSSLPSAIPSPGRRPKLEDCWTRSQNEIRLLCRRLMAGDWADGDDAFSRVGLAVYQPSRTAGRTIGNPEGFLRRLAFNVCMDLHRENSRRADRFLHLESLSIAAEVDNEQQDAETFLLARELQQQLHSAIAELPERLRLTLRAHLEEGNHCLVARRLSIGEANVRKRLQQARDLLRPRLEPDREDWLRGWS